MSYLSSSSYDDIDEFEDAEVVKSNNFHNEIYFQLLSDPYIDEPAPSSGYVGEPITLSEEQPLFIVVDYYEQDIADSFGQYEVIIRLWPGIGHEEQFVHLQDEWATSTKINIGDPVFVLGEWSRRDEINGIYSNKLAMDITCQRNYIITLPHLLIPGTRLAKCQECMRKAYLDDLIPKGFSSLEMYSGTIIHELIQSLLSGTPVNALDDKLENYIQNDLFSLYAINYTPESFKQKLVDEGRLGVVQKIGEAFQNHHETTPNVKLITLEETRPFTLINSLPPFGCAPIKMEENLWSFQWGLKGKIDVTLSDGNRHIPLELKSGRSLANGPSPHDPHTLQLSAYIFMMKEKYKDKAQDFGALYYAKDSVSFRVFPHHLELFHIIMMRNTIAHAIAHGSVPRTTASQRACKFCEGKSACAFLEINQTRQSPLHSSIKGYLTYTPKEHHYDFHKRWENILLEEMQVARDAQTTIWLSPIKRRVNAGRAMENLTFTCYKDKDVIELTFPDKTCLTRSSISVSNFVIFTRKGLPPIVGRGSVMICGENSLQVEMIESSLEVGETDICIDLWESTTGTDICRENLMSLFAQHDDNIVGFRLRELVVDGETPLFDQLPDASMFTQYGLNEDQTIAMRTALAARDYMLLLGMPGTGKTTTVASLIASMAKAGQHILIASYTHTAVDNLCLKLLEQGVKFIRVGKSTCLHNDIAPYSLDSIVSECQSVEEIGTIIDNCNIFATTCLGYHHPLIVSRVYDVCVIDEASQINIPTVLGPLSRAKRFILVGDHYQLSPIMKYGTDMMAEAPPSLFKLLCEAHPHALVTLRTQYRMNNEILKLCNHLIYGYRMRTGDSTVGHARMQLPRLDTLNEFHDLYKSWLSKVIVPEPPVVVVNTDNVPMKERRGVSSKLNNGEAAIVSVIAISMFLCGCPPEHIGIISPYRAQVILIRDAILDQLKAVCSFYPEIDDVNKLAERFECYTVDKFQGRDKECVIFSSVKSNNRNSPGHHITDWQRLNVAITRAKTKFILVSSVKTVMNAPIFSSMFRVLDKRTNFVDLPEGIDEFDAKPFTAMSSIVSHFDQ